MTSARGRGHAKEGGARGGHARARAKREVRVDPGPRPLAYICISAGLVYLNLTCVCTPGRLHFRFARTPGACASPPSARVCRGVHARDVSVSRLQMHTWPVSISAAFVYLVCVRVRIRLYVSFACDLHIRGNITCFSAEFAYA